jgi:hypothetical protein
MKATKFPVQRHIMAMIEVSSEGQVYVTQPEPTNFNNGSGRSDIIWTSVVYLDSLKRVFKCEMYKQALIVAESVRQYRREVGK